MNTHDTLSVVTCVGHLGFALLVLARRERSPLSVSLIALFGTAFAYTFAELAFHLTGERSWHYIDRFCSTFMAVLLLQLVVTFVGSARAMRRVLSVCWGLSLALALSSPFLAVWWKLLCLAGLSALVTSLSLLLRHRSESTDPNERATTELIFVASLLGTLLGLTDLWRGELSFELPPLGNLGTLFALGLIAVAALRLRLLGRELPALFAAYALLAGLLSVAAYLTVVRVFPGRVGLWILSALSAVLIAAGALREASRAAAAARQRVERLAGLGRFSAHLAHNLRNPLSALKGALQFLAVERRDGRSLDAHGEFIDLMLDQVERVNAVLEDYQRLAQLNPLLSLKSLSELVNEVIQLQRYGAVANIELRAELAPGLPKCEIDATLIATALENILRNAYEAMPDGGTVTVRLERAAPGADGVVLSVQDQGQGMDPRELARATEEFFTTKSTGTGLGLNFVDRVAKAHGGTLEISSQIRKGTLVKLRVPSQRAIGEAP
jgi:two-component system, NtrC family, sensor histidine kinase HydH